MISRTCLALLLCPPAAFGANRLQSDVDRTSGRRCTGTAPIGSGLLPVPERQRRRRFRRW